MDLQTNAWYVRLFFWSLAVWEKFSDRENHLIWQHRNQTNLCFFMRVIILWLPLAILGHLVVVAVGLMALVTVPIGLFGWNAYAWVIGMITLIVAVLFGYDAYLLRRKNKPEPEMAELVFEEEPEIHDLQEAPAIATGPSFWQVVIEWLIAKKQKICLQIVFKQGDGHGIM